MFYKIADFKKAYGAVSDGTVKIMAAMIDKSLGQQIAADHRTLGRIAWHIVQTIPEMMNKTGLAVTGPAEHDPVPDSAAEIARQYELVSKAIIKEVAAKWKDADLLKEDEMYGQKWVRGFTLRGLCDHEIHHRGQMTVLMRQAGLKVPGIYGPSLEEWAQYGMPAPKI